MSTTLNYDQFGQFKNFAASKMPVRKAGTPVIEFINIFGRKFLFPYKTRRQFNEASAMVKLMRVENQQLKNLLDEYNVKCGKWVNEPKLRRELRDTFGMTKPAIDKLLSVH